MSRYIIDHIYHAQYTQQYTIIPAIYHVPVYTAIYHAPVYQQYTMPQYTQHTIACPSIAIYHAPVYFLQCVV